MVQGTTSPPQGINPVAATHSTSAHAGMLAHFFTPGTDFLIVASIVLLLLLLWMPVTREILKGIFGTLLMPVFSAIFLATFHWMVKTGRTIVDAHLILFRNLYSSHKDIHPNLEDPKRK